MSKFLLVTFFPNSEVFRKVVVLARLQYASGKTLVKVGEYRTVVNVIVVADVRGAAESVYLGATRSDEFFFLGRCGSSYQDSLPLAKLGLSTLSLLGSSGSNGISLYYINNGIVIYLFFFFLHFLKLF